MYTCVIGMPGFEATLEEIMCWVLGHYFQSGTVAKLANNLYCGGETIDYPVNNWSRILRALERSRPHLSSSKTTISPCMMTIVGWTWSTLYQNALRFYRPENNSRKKFSKLMNSFYHFSEAQSRLLTNKVVLLPIPSDGLSLMALCANINLTPHVMLHARGNFTCVEMASKMATMWNWSFEHCSHNKIFQPISYTVDIPDPCTHWQ